MSDALDLTNRKEPLLQAVQGGRSLWDDARARLFRNKAAVASMWVLAIMVLIAIIVLKRMQARTRSKTDAPDIILRQDEDDGDQGR